MEEINNFLYYELITLESADFIIAPVNLILIGLSFLFYFVTKKVLWRSLIRIGDKSERIDQQKETIYRLLRQILIFVTLMFVVDSFNVNNPRIDFGNFLHLNITGDYNGFQLSVYHVFLAIAVFFLLKVGLNLFKLYLHRTLKEKDWVDEGKEFTIIQLVKYFVYTVAVISLIRSTGVRLDWLITSSAALFVGLGLGLQNIFADFVSGILLLFEGTVKVGDVVELNQNICRVETINIRTSKVLTRDGEIIIVPNSKLTTDSVINWSHQDKLMRFTIKVGVAYGSDVRLVEKLLLESVKIIADLSNRRPPHVFFSDFGDNALIFDVTFWAERSFRAEVSKSDVRFEIDRLFRENNIKIPFPQREVYMYNKGSVQS